MNTFLGIFTRNSIYLCYCYMGIIRYKCDLKRVLKNYQVLFASSLKSSLGFRQKCCSTQAISGYRCMYRQINIA